MYTIFFTDLSYFNENNGTKEIKARNYKASSVPKCVPFLFLCAKPESAWPGFPLLVDLVGKGRTRVGRFDVTKFSPVPWDGKK